METELNEEEKREETKAGGMGLSAQASREELSIIWWPTVHHYFKILMQIAEAMKNSAWVSASQKGRRTLATKTTNI